MTDRTPLDHLTHDQYDHLCDRLEHAEAQLTRYAEGDAADAASGSYAGRAEEAEAALARVRGLVDEWDMHAPPPGNRPLIELRAALDGPGRADSTPAELTADEARDHADELSTDLYQAEDRLAFVGECCDIADRKGHQPTTADVREWLKGARCRRQLAADAAQSALAGPEPEPEPAACDTYQPPATPADTGLCAHCGMHDWKHQATTAVDRQTAVVLAALHRSAEDTVTRVIDLYETWVKAGPPPLGMSMSRWWDVRLVELRAAILPTTDQPKEKRP